MLRYFFLSVLLINLIRFLYMLDMLTIIFIVINMILVLDILKMVFCLLFLQIFGKGFDMLGVFISLSILNIFRRFGMFNVFKFISLLIYFWQFLHLLKLFLCISSRSMNAKFGHSMMLLTRVIIICKFSTILFRKR